VQRDTPVIDRVSAAQILPTLVSVDDEED